MSQASTHRQPRYLGSSHEPKHRMRCPIHGFIRFSDAERKLIGRGIFQRLRLIRTLDSTEFDSTEKLLAWNDVTALGRLFEDAADTTSAGYPWARRIIERDHHRQVFSLDEGDGAREVRKAKRMLAAVRDEFSDVEFVEDFPDKQVSIHKIERADDQEAGKIDFPLIDHGKRTSLGDRSHLLKRLPAGFRIGYVFADVVDREKRKTISERCRELFNSQT